MLAEIITIGDEILIGQIVDTNSAWMATELNKIGIKVKQITSISDSEEHILSSLKEAEQRAEIILITGGLGPTRDDITKQTLCKYFDSKLILNAESLANVERLFGERGLAVTEINREQAEVPHNCVSILNKNGTAPAMWFDKNDKVFVSMPGVPYEMKYIMQDYVLQKLVQKFALPVVKHKTILTIGIGESFLAEKIKDWEDSLEKDNIKLAYLPSPGTVRLRMSVTGKDEQELNILLENKTADLKKLIGDLIYGYENDTLEALIGQILKQRGKTIATAESCTGGYLAHKITSVPGSSDYYKGSVISYSNDIKVKELGVNAETISKHGAVSQQVVEEMANNVREKYKTDYALATSGIAGPDGGTEEKPVGTVWIAMAGPTGVFSKKYLMGNNRERNIHKSALYALNMLRKRLIEEML